MNLNVIHENRNKSARDFTLKVIPIFRGDIEGKITMEIFCGACVKHRIRGHGCKNEGNKHYHLNFLHAEL